MGGPENGNIKEEGFHEVEEGRRLIKIEKHVRDGICFCCEMNEF